MEKEEKSEKRYTKNQKILTEIEQDQLLTILGSQNSGIKNFLNIIFEKEPQIQARLNEAQKEIWDMIKIALEDDGEYLSNRDIAVQLRHNSHSYIGRQRKELMSIVSKVMREGEVYNENKTPIRPQVQ